MIDLAKFIGSSDAYGRAKGREVYQKLLGYVEDNSDVVVFKISMKDVKRLDMSFISETVVELARRYRGSKGFCFIDLTDPDLIENCDAAAGRQAQPMVIWDDGKPRPIGHPPSAGNRDAYLFALERPTTRTAEFVAAHEGMSIANASTKFKQLWEQGFLLRRESPADTGGVEYVYERVG